MITLTSAQSGDELEIDHARVSGTTVLTISNFASIENRACVTLRAPSTTLSLLMLLSEEEENAVYEFFAKRRRQRLDARFPEEGM